jgi:hypothetical protein
MRIKNQHSTLGYINLFVDMQLGSTAKENTTNRHTDHISSRYRMHYTAALTFM